MKTSLKINLILIGIIVSYLLIAVRGEHLGGPLGLFIFMNFFSKELIQGVVPSIGILLLIITLFINRKRLLYLMSMLFVYPTLILYIIELIHNKDFVDEITPVVSMIPFFILTVVGAIILLLKKENTSRA